MAITRAQQFRQMLKDGNVAVQGGVKNYLGEQETVSDVPIKWKSGPNKPATELAYITDAEKKLLLKEDIHGSLKDGPNEGPEGIISLDSAGDAEGPTGGFSGEDVSAAERGETPKGMTENQARGFRAGAISAGARVKGTDDLQTLAEANKIAKGVRDRYAKQKNLTLGERVNLYNIGVRQKAIDRYINQRKDKIMSGLSQLDINPAYDDPDETFADLISEAPSIAGMTDKFSQETIDDVLAGNRQIDFFSKIDPNLAPGLATKGLVGLANLVGPALGGPVTKEKLQDLLSEVDTLSNLGIDVSKTTTKDLMKEFAPNQYDMVYGPPKGGDGGGQQVYIPPTVTSDTDDLDDDYYASVGGDPFKNRKAYRLFNQGGIADTVVGGEFDFESARQMYGLGKLVKKVTRTVKKIAKSPIGKAALLYAGGSYLSGMGAFGGLKGAGIFKPQAIGLKNFFMGKPLGFKTGLDSVARGPGFLERLGIGKAGLGIAGISALAGLMTKGDEEDEDEEQYRGEKLDIAGIRRDPYAFIPNLGM